MRFYPDDNQLLLDPMPLAASELRRNTKFKMRCGRYVEGEGPEGTLVLRVPASHREWAKMSGRLSAVAKALGCSLEADPELVARYEALRENAEEHFRAGNEIKRGDHKYDAALAEFSRVVDAAMVRPLKDQQMRDAFFLATMARAGNFSVPGSGKTATVLGAFAFLAARHKASRLLVVCPKNAFDSWKTEWRLCFGEKCPLSCFSTQDEAYQRLSRKDRKGLIRSGVGGKNLLLANYESTVGIAEELGELASKETLLVFDEVHRVKRVGGKWATAALTIANQAAYTFALTGTPLPNTYVDLYNFLHILYPREYDSFFGFEKGELKAAGPEEQQAINDRIQPFFCRTNKDDLGVPPAEPDSVEEVWANERQETLLGVLKNRYHKNKLTLMLRVLQMENDPMDLLEELDPKDYRWILEEDEATGDVDVVDYSEKIVEMIKQAGGSGKRERCLGLVEGLVRQGRPVIVWCIFVKSMYDVAGALEARGVRARVISGDTFQDDRTQLLDDFRAGRFDVLVTNPHTLAESVSLHSVCHDAVYYEYSFNLVHLLQSKDRIHRLGLAAGQRTRYYYLCQTYPQVMVLRRDGGQEPFSMDREIYDRLRMKEETMLRAIDADLIETQPTTQEDLDAIFEGLFGSEVRS